jgi:hypothetical protein
MRNLVLFGAISFVLPSVLDGCTYEENIEETQPVYSLDAGDADMGDTGRMHNRKDWAQSGELAVQGTRAVGLQATFDPNDGKVHTVQFIVATPQAPWGGNPAAPLPQLPLDGAFVAYAKIQWSVNGSDITRVVSVVNGMSIAGVGEAVKVSCYDATPIDVGNITPGTLYGVTATVAPGTRGSNINPPYWAPPLTAPIAVPASTSNRQTIPQNIGANALNILFAQQDAGGLPIVPPDMFVVFIGPGGLNLGVYTPTSADEWVPIPPLAQAFQINNASTTQALTYTYYLGIDG